jgi:hypothetical protein
MSEADLADLKIMLFTGLTWFSFICFMISALVIKQIEATLSTGLIMVLSIITIHEYRLRKLENEIKKLESEK